MVHLRAPRSHSLIRRLTRAGFALVTLGITVVAFSSAPAGAYYIGRSFIPPQAFAVFGCKQITINAAATHAPRSVTLVFTDTTSETWTALYTDSVYQGDTPERSTLLGGSEANGNADKIIASATMVDSAGLDSTFLPEGERDCTTLPEATHVEVISDITFTMTATSLTIDSPGALRSVYAYTPNAVRSHSYDVGTNVTSVVLSFDTPWLQRINVAAASVDGNELAISLYTPFELVNSTAGLFAADMPPLRVGFRCAAAGADAMRLTTGVAQIAQLSVEFSDGSVAVQDYVPFVDYATAVAPEGTIITRYGYVVADVEGGAPAHTLELTSLTQEQNCSQVGPPPTTPPVTVPPTPTTEAPPPTTEAPAILTPITVVGPDTPLPVTGGATPTIGWALILAGLLIATVTGVRARH